MSEASNTRMKGLCRISVILLFAALLPAAGAAQAQTVVYNQTRGTEHSTITWVKTTNGGKIHITTTQGAEIQEYVMDSNYTTLLWKYTDTAAGTSINTAKTSAGYTISGTLNGKPYTKTLSSKGRPWYQNIGFNIGREMAGRDSFRFECIRPDNLKLYEMQADRKGAEQMDGISVQRIDVHLTGALAKFFGSDYYIDANTGEYVKYRGVQGPPGTPETIITLKR